MIESTATGSTKQQCRCSYYYGSAVGRCLVLKENHTSITDHLFVHEDYSWPADTIISTLEAGSAPTTEQAVEQPEKQPKLGECQLCDFQGTLGETIKHRRQTQHLIREVYPQSGSKSQPILDPRIEQGVERPRMYHGPLSRCQHGADSSTPCGYTRLQHETGHAGHPFVAPTQTASKPTLIAECAHGPTTFHGEPGLEVSDCCGMDVSPHIEQAASKQREVIGVDYEKDPVTGEVFVVQTFAEQATLGPSVINDTISVQHETHELSKAIEGEPRIRQAASEQTTCTAQADFEILDEGERRPDMGVTYSCSQHVGTLIGSTPPTDSIGPWQVKAINDPVITCCYIRNANLAAEVAKEARKHFGVQAASEQVEHTHFCDISPIAHNSNVTCYCPCHGLRPQKEQAAEDAKPTLPDDFILDDRANELVDEIVDWFGQHINVDVRREIFWAVVRYNRRAQSPIAIDSATLALDIAREIETYLFGGNDLTDHVAVQAEMSQRIVPLLARLPIAVDPAGLSGEYCSQILSAIMWLGSQQWVFKYKTHLEAADMLGALEGLPAAQMICAYHLEHGLSRGEAGK